MTPGVGLSSWERIGSLHRELRPYVEYVNRGWKVKILTYDRGRIPALPHGIEAVKVQFPRLPGLLSIAHWDVGKWADLIKTNQSAFAYYYTKAARRWKKPLLLRCGYVHGEYLETSEGTTRKTINYQRREANAFKDSAHCLIPTEELSLWVQNNYKISTEKITVNPNFVDTSVFRPIENVEKIERSVISVGRLAPVKRFDLLLKACATVPGCTLTLVGEGPERQALAQLAGELGIELHLPGNIPNEELPKVLQRHQVFAITSMWEGHPKSLIEAMACGMPCVGANSVGIQNVIRHGETGFLAEDNAEAIKVAILTMMKQNGVSHSLSKNSISYVNSSYSFDKCFIREFCVAERL